jgi:hypothetical protein
MSAVDPLNIAVLLGSERTGRQGEHVLNVVKAALKQRQTKHHVTIIDALEAGRYMCNVCGCVTVNLFLIQSSPCVANNGIFHFFSIRYSAFPPLHSIQISLSFVPLIITMVHMFQEYHQHHYQL